MKLSEELAWRGFANQTTYADLSELDAQPVHFYWGIDPSADSMTIGNLAAAMMVRCFLRHGHKGLILVGGATGMIGDPDGKREERNLKTLEEIVRNKKALTEQCRHFFGKSVKFTDNLVWFKDMHYLEFLREVGKNVPLRQMLAREFVQSRLGEGGAGISYAEFSYVLIQAYDFLQLYEKEHVTLQLAGSDQWGNSIAGVDLIRRKTGGEAHVLSLPLVVNQATGRKFGKTEEGAIWLDAAKTTPTQFYQFWINVDDAGVESYLKIYTELTKAEIDKVMHQHRRAPHDRYAQETLASHVTRIVHGPENTAVAEKVTAVLTNPVGALDTDLGKNILSELRKEIPYIKAGPDHSIVQALVETGLAASNTEARRLIESNAISINKKRVTRENFETADFINGRLLLRRGKAFKDSALIEKA